MEKRDFGKRAYSSTIQVAIFMLYISSVCVAGVVEYTDEVAFKNDTGNPQFFIDFETYGDGTPVPPNDVNVTGDEWLNLGIQFAPKEIGFSMILSAKPGMNVSPPNEPGHALAIAGLSPGNDRSSFLITFPTPVISFGVYIVDNETGGPGAYPIERIILKDEDGNIIGDFAMPGGAGPAPPLPFAHDFIGYSSTIPIAEVHIIEANDGEGSLLDNVMYSVPEPAVEMEWVTIGNAGNPGDTRTGIDPYSPSGNPMANPYGCGAVGYEYQIGKYEVTNAQWNAFTSAAGAPTGNPSNAYDQTSTYPGAQQPTNEVSWYEAAQFCNYLTSGDKSLGAYLFSGNNTNPGDFLSIDRTAAQATYGTIYFLPTEDEWYKAAYYKPDGSGYSSFANGLDTMPVVGGGWNYYDSTPWNVGTGTEEQNGTFDMMGNVWEWNETLMHGSYRSARSGSFYVGHLDGFTLSSSHRHYMSPDDDWWTVGFRVARTAEPAGPVAYWSFDDTGNPGHDDSGNGHNGTIYGAASTDGTCGKALSFDGNGDYANFGNTIGNFGVDDFSVVFWFRSDTERKETVMGKRVFCGEHGFFELNMSHPPAPPGHMLVEIYEGYPSIHGSFNSNQRLDDDQWHLLAITRQGVQGKLYIDGVLDASRSAAKVINMSNSASFLMGNGPCYPVHSDFFSGELDEVRIYDRALSAEEIAELIPEPNIAVSPLSHDFGDVELGTSSTVVVTISNVGNGDLNVSGIALETDFAITSAPAAAIVVEPGATVDVEITYTPTVLGDNSAVLKITSDDPDEPVVEVQLSATGVEIPPPPSEQIANILAFFDASMGVGSLVGDGPGSSAEKRLNALRNMIEAAGDLIENELLEEACQQLLDVYNRMDGQPKPPDFVTAEAVPELATMVQDLMTTLGCE